MSNTHCEEQIFHVAREIANPTARLLYLKQICADNESLRRRVEALLEIEENDASFLKSQAEPASTQDASPLTEAPGQQIGRYKLLQQIGEGGMGTVFMAEQTRPVTRRVALKIIKQGMDTKAVIARFEAERQALAMMDHPGIAKVLDAGTTDSGRPYFVMELVKGVPITEYCDEKNLSIKARLGLFIEVCRAVQHAHQKGIIHRDIKPSNVLVAMYDGKPVPKIIDFGVAKATGQRLTERTMFTQFGQIVGTLEYMSPEQAQFNQLDVDTRSDIYSLGVLLYELLTGVTPFDSSRLRSSAFEEVMRILKEEEPPKPSTRISTLGEMAKTISSRRACDPSALGGTIRGDLDWIVMKALEKERVRRYETAIAFSDDIDRYLADETITARPPSSALRFAKMLRRNRALAASIACVVAALSIGLLTTSLALDESRQLASEIKELVFEQGLSECTSGDYAAAEETIDRLERIRGADDLAKLLRSFLLIVKDDHEDAIDILNPMVREAPELTAARGLLTYAYEGAGDLNAFFESHATLKQLEPRTAEDYLFKALGYGIEPQRGVELMDQAIELRRSPVAHLIRGRMLADWAVQTGRAELIDRSNADIDRASAWLGVTGNVGLQLLRAHTCNMYAARACGEGEKYDHSKSAARAVVAKLQHQVASWHKNLFLGFYYYEIGDKRAALNQFEDASLAGIDYLVPYYLALAYELNVAPKDSVLQADTTGPYARYGRAMYLACTDGDLQKEKCLSLANEVMEAYPYYPDAVMCGLHFYLWYGEFSEAANRATEKRHDWRDREHSNWQSWEAQHLVNYAINLNESQLLNAAESSAYPDRWNCFAHAFIGASAMGHGQIAQAEDSFQACVDQQVPYVTFLWWCRAMLERPPKSPVDTQL